MKHLLLTTIAAVLVVGCGESQQSAPSPEAKPEPTTAKAPDIDIHDAARTGDIEVVKQYIATGADVDAKTALEKGTPLDQAASWGHKEIVELLIAEGADVNAKGKLGKTPLHSAASDGHKEIVELLIANGAVVNAKDEIESTPLSGAALNGHKEIAELLIAAGADVNAKNVSGWTPLDSAKRNALILRGFGFEERSEDKVKAAKKEIVDLLRKHGGKTREWLNADNSIHRAASAGHIEAVKQHIATGADVNAKNKPGNTPLHFAAAYGGKETVELLIASGADVNAKNGYGNDETPLDWAIKRNNHPETVELLRKHGGKTGEELKAEEK